MADVAVEQYAGQVESRRPLTGIRRLTAERMALSHREIPGVLVVEECDVTDLNMGTLVAVIAATMGSLVADFPAFNAHVQDGELVLFERCDIAVAVDTPRGLMVPVLRDCAHRTVEDLHDDVKALADKARAGRLTGSDVQGATATLTSPGKRGGFLATPLINHPQTAIVGFHRAIPRVVPTAEGYATRRISNLTVTFDHRVIDGATAGDFTIALARGIESGGAH